MPVSLSGSDKQTHRTWIRQARLQSEEADRNEAEARHNAIPAGEPLQTDIFPGYLLEREIHRGGQGTVYRAVQESTGRRVAVKLLHNHTFGSHLERARFERETHILAALQHPNIVAIHDGGSHDGRFFLVMDYIGGQPLDVYIASETRSIREILGLFIQICDAVNAAHIGGIIHRDIKPANVRVDSTGRPIVLDFGLAKFTAGALDGAAKGMTLTGQFVGSLPWAAPEQADGSPDRIDTRTDVYALGVLFYQMLTGKFPYPVVGPVRSILDNILKAEPVHPRSLSRAIDDELETIVLKCLSKERERRYQTAGELGGDLRRYLSGEPIEAKRDSALYLLRKTVRRYRMALGVVAGFVLLLFGSSIVAWTLWVRARDAAVAATHAEKNAQVLLRDSLISEARAIRRSGRIGQRFTALEALAKSAAIGPTLEARNEAIAAMALPDLRLVRQLKESGTGFFDSRFERCAVKDARENFIIVRVEDDSEICRVPAPSCGTKEFHHASLCGRFLVRTFDPPTGDRRLEVWAIPEGRLHLDLSDVPYQARYDISADGKRLAVGRLDKAIHIYDLESAKEVQRVGLDRNPSYLSFDPSGRRLALYHGNFVGARILDLVTGASEPAFDARVGWSVAWHPRGSLLAGANGNRIELWDADTRSSRGVLAGHESTVVRIQFSSDGKMLLTYSWEGETILWDARTRRPLLRMRAGLPSFSSDDSRVGYTAVAFGPRVHVLELCGAPERCRLVGAGDTDSIVGARGSFDSATGLLFVANMSATKASGLQVFDAKRGNVLAGCTGVEIKSLAIDRRGRFMLTGGSEGVFWWPIRSTQSGVSVASAEPLLSAQSVDSVDVSADGAVAVALPDPGGEFLLLEPGKVGSVRRYACSIHRGSVIRVSPDGRWASWGGWQGSTGEVWDLEKGARVLNLSVISNTGVAFSHDSLRFVSSQTDSLALWATDTWQRLRTVTGQFGGVCFSPDGRLIAATLGTTIICIVDAETLEELARLEPPENYTTEEFSFSPDGTLLAQITNRAGVVHVWDLRRIRAGLAAINLDWAHAPYPPANHDKHPSNVSIHGPTTRPEK